MTMTSKMMSSMVSFFLLFFVVGWGSKNAALIRKEEEVLGDFESRHHHHYRHHHAERGGGHATTIRSNATESQTQFVVEKHAIQQQQKSIQKHTIAVSKDLIQQSTRSEERTRFEDVGTIMLDNACPVGVYTASKDKAAPAILAHPMINPFLAKEHLRPLEGKYQSGENSNDKAAEDANSPAGKPPAEDPDDSAGEVSTGISEVDAVTSADSSTAGFSFFSGYQKHDLKHGSTHHKLMKQLARHRTGKPEPQQKDSTVGVPVVDVFGKPLPKIQPPTLPSYRVGQPFSIPQCIEYCMDHKNEGEPCIGIEMVAQCRPKGFDAKIKIPGAISNAETGNKPVSKTPQKEPKQLGMASTTENKQDNGSKSVDTSSWQCDQGIVNHVRDGLKVLLPYYFKNGETSRDKANLDALNEVISSFLNDLFLRFTNKGADNTRGTSLLQRQSVVGQASILEAQQDYAEKLDKMKQYLEFEDGRSILEKLSTLRRHMMLGGNLDALLRLDETSLVEISDQSLFVSTHSNLNALESHLMETGNSLEQLGVSLVQTGVDLVKQIHGDIGGLMQTGGGTHKHAMQEMMKKNADWISKSIDFSCKMVYKKHRVTPEAIQQSQDTSISAASLIESSSNDSFATGSNSNKVLSDADKAERDLQKQQSIVGYGEPLVYNIDRDEYEHRPDEFLQMDLESSSNGNGDMEGLIELDSANQPGTPLSDLQTPGLKPLVAHSSSPSTPSSEKKTNPDKGIVAVAYGDIQGKKKGVDPDNRSSEIIIGVADASGPPSSSICLLDSETQDLDIEDKLCDTLVGAKQITRRQVTAISPTLMNMKCDWKPFKTEIERTFDTSQYTDALLMKEGWDGFLNMKEESWGISPKQCNDECEKTKCKGITYRVWSYTGQCFESDGTSFKDYLRKHPDDLRIPFSECFLHQDLPVRHPDLITTKKSLHSVCLRKKIGTTFIPANEPIPTPMPPETKEAIEHTESMRKQMPYVALVLVIVMLVLALASIVMIYHRYKEMTADAQEEIDEAKAEGKLLEEKTDEKDELNF